MSRAVRITVGSVVAGVLAFVALVSGVMAAAGSGGGGDPFAFLDAGVDTPATAEVLDVDDYDPSWPMVDVRWTTPEGEVVVTYIEWERGELPEIGDEVEVLYDPADPEYALPAGDAAGGPDTSAGSDVAGEGEAAPGAGDDLFRTAGWVSSVALLGVVVTAVVTSVAAVRAPAPPTPAHLRNGFDVLPPLAYQPAPGQYAGPARPGPAPTPCSQPYPQPYAQQPPPQAPPPQRGSWPHPG